MLAESHQGVVLRAVNHGDSSRIVHFLTEEGRLAAYAPGARKSRRRFGGALQPFGTVTLVLSRSARKKDALPTLSQVTTQRARLGIQGALESIMAASYLTELCERVAPEEDSSPKTFALLESALDYLDETGHPPPGLVERAFELRLLDALGYRPVLDRCAACGLDARDAADVVHLDLAQGGVLCASHARYARRIGPKTLQWVRAVLESSSFAPLPLGTEADAQTAADKAAPSLLSFYETLLSRPLRTPGVGLAVASIAGRREAPINPAD